MNPDQWGPLVGLIGVLIGWLGGRRKNKADTAAVLNETALELLVPLRGEIKELRGELTVYKQRVGSLERQEREILQALAVHAGWDAATWAAAHAAGIDVAQPPPLFNPRSERTRAEDQPQ